jgi:hypothetical protein
MITLEPWLTRATKNELDQWLTRATKCLSQESRTTVRAEIQDHYEAGRDEAISHGASPHEAEAIALRALGDPARANRLYRRALLTGSEAQVLARGRSEARFICTSPLLRNAFLAMPAIALLAGLIAWFLKANSLAAFLLPVGFCLSVLLHGPFFPIYTQPRSRIYHAIKWTALTVLFSLLMLTLGWKYAWLGTYSLCITAYAEWTRFIIRRKLPASQWPRHLYR